jgi:predicted RND superfamily exporter protein
MPTKQPSFLARTTLGPPNYLLVAMATLFMLAMAPLGARKAVQRQANQIDSWLPPSNGAVVDDRWLSEQFDGQQFVLASWDECTLGKPAKLATLARKLQQAAAGRDSAIARIETGPQWIARLTAPPYNLAYEGAVDRLEGTFVGQPQQNERGASLGHASRRTCLAAYLTPIAAADDAAVAETLEQIRRAAAESGVDPALLRLAGPAVDAMRIGRESLASLWRWGGLAVAFGIAVCAWRLRSLRLAAIVALPAVASGAAMLAIVFYSGVLEVLGLGRATPLLGVVDGLVLATPAMIYAMTLVAGVRYVHYYRDARLTQGVAGAAEQAVADGWPAWGIVALLFAAMAGAFCFSELLPLRRFGLFAGLGALASVGALLSILPVWFHRFPLSDREVRAIAGPRQDGSLPSRLSGLFDTAVTGRGLMALVGVAALAASAAGLEQLAPPPRWPELVGGRSALVADHDWFATHLGHAVAVEIVLTIPDERNRVEGEVPEVDGQQYRMTLAEQLALASKIDERVQALPEISGVLSAATLQPAGAMPGDVTPLERDLSELQLVRQERRSGSDLKAERQLWRISGRLKAATPGAAVDYRVTRDQLRDAVNPVLRAYQQRDWLVRNLSERGVKLTGAAICVLFHADADAAAPREGTPEALLSEVLNRSSIQRGGVTFFNVATLEREGQAGAAAQERAAETLRTAAAVILVAPAKSRAVSAAMDGLATAGVNIVNLATLPSIEESIAAGAVESGGPRPIQVVLTGAPMVAGAVSDQAQATLARAWTLILPGVAVAMMCIVWHPVVGLATVAAVSLPAAVTLGVIGWLGVNDDLSIVLVAGLASGLAIDAAVHYIAWFRRGLHAGLFRHEAARMAFARCAPAAVDGALAVGIGLSALALSPVTPFHLLGLTALGMTAAVLFASLVMLPAIVASPLTAMMGAEAAPAAAEEAIASVRIVLPGEGDGEIRPGRTDAPASGVPTPAHRGRSAAPQPEEAHDPEGPHAALQAKLQRLRHAASE